MRRAVLVLAALAAGAGAWAADDGQAAKDLKALQGTWKLTSYTRGGKRAPKEDLKGSTLTITGDRYRRMNAGKVLAAGRVRLDPSKAPKVAEWDMEDPEKKVTIATVPMIYRVAGDRLDLCVGDKDRPEKFESQEGTDIEHLVYERVKKKG